MIDLHLAVADDDLDTLRELLPERTTLFTQNAVAESGDPTAGDWDTWGEPSLIPDGPRHVVIRYPDDTASWQILSDIAFLLVDVTFGLQGDGTMAVITDSDDWGKQYLRLQNLSGGLS